METIVGMIAYKYENTHFIRAVV